MIGMVLTFRSADVSQFSCCLILFFFLVFIEIYFP